MPSFGGDTEALAQLITQITLILLSAAAFIFVFQLVRQRRAGELSAWSFSTILLVVLIGWIATEVLRDAGIVDLGDLGRVAHFAMMALLALTITLQFRFSTRR